MAKISTNSEAKQVNKRLRVVAVTSQESKDSLQSFSDVALRNSQQQLPKRANDLNRDHHSKSSKKRKNKQLQNKLKVNSNNLSQLLQPDSLNSKTGSNRETPWMTRKRSHSDPRPKIEYNFQIDMLILKSMNNQN